VNRLEIQLVTVPKERVAKYWELFAPHHYDYGTSREKLANGSRKYLAFWKGRLVGFVAAIHSFGKLDYWRGRPRKKSKPLSEKQQRLLEKLQRPTRIPGREPTPRDWEQAPIRKLQKKIADIRRCRRRVKTVEAIQRLEQQEVDLKKILKTKLSVEKKKRQQKKRRDLRKAWDAAKQARAVQKTLKTREQILNHFQNVSRGCATSVREMKPKKAYVFVANQSAFLPLTAKVIKVLGGLPAGTVSRAPRRVSEFSCWSGTEWLTKDSRSLNDAKKLSPFNSKLETPLEKPVEQTEPTEQPTEKLTEQARWSFTSSGGIVTHWDYEPSDDELAVAAGWSNIEHKKRFEPETYQKIIAIVRREYERQRNETPEPKHEIVRPEPKPKAPELSREDGRYGVPLPALTPGQDYLKMLEQERIREEAWRLGRF
jgi:hypothetical protein